MSIGFPSRSCLLMMRTACSSSSFTILENKLIDFGEKTGLTTVRLFLCSWGSRRNNRDLESPIASYIYSALRYFPWGPKTLSKGVRRQCLEGIITCVVMTYSRKNSGSSMVRKSGATLIIGPKDSMSGSGVTLSCSRRTIFLV